MTKLPTKTDKPQQDREEPRDAFEADVRRMLKALLPRKTRADLAAGLTKVMARKITGTMIDSWVAEGKYQPRLPLSLAKALARLIADPSITRYLNTEEELVLIRIGEHARANQKLVAQLATPKAKGRQGKRR